MAFRSFLLIGIGLVSWGCGDDVPIGDDDTGGTGGIGAQAGTGGGAGTTSAGSGGQGNAGGCQTGYSAGAPGSSCTTSDECASDEVCGFKVAEACTATG